MNEQEKQIRSRLRWGIAGIFIALIVSFAYDVPQVFNSGLNALGLGEPIQAKEFRLGLDLQGGAQLVYHADVSRIDSADQQAAVEGVRDVIERRVNSTGVSEASVRTALVGDEYRLNVELPGEDDINHAIELIGQTPILEFQVQSNEPPRELTEQEQEDIDRANEDAQSRAQAAKNEISDGAITFEEAVDLYSEDDVSKVNDGYLGFITDEIPEIEPLYAWAAQADEGDVSDVIESEVGYHIVRRGGQDDAGGRVTAKHILICYLGSQSCTSDRSKSDAEALASRLFNEANANNFSELAEEYSDDTVSANNGGELNPFTKGVMIPAFENAAFSAEVGQIVGPVESPFGYHIIYKTDEEEVTSYEVSHVMFNKMTAFDILGPQTGWETTALSGKQLERADVVTDPNTGAVQVGLQFDREGTQLFADLTQEYLGQPIGIFLDGEPISTPVVQSVISNGQAVITGNFTIQEARLLSQRLNTGALPVPIELISQQRVGATLGAQSLAQSLKAGIISIIVVMIFMVAYYRLPGVLSVIALGLYIGLTLAIFKLIGVTLTLAGIAGFILSIGMAVDANVLIFERLKEELRSGKSLRVAVEEGFIRAWTSIRDGNVSTLITCVLLIGFGSSFVQGFAATLAIGVLVSMFSAITITRALLRFVVPWFDRFGNKLYFLGAASDKKE